ncbi:MAG: hypothetical protein JWO86_4555 [Myxococcaceae bacterium]|nr:hypothetical protein [Myxococcaceae bacterium]MEA2749782.1 hypothetical protein [Myxococcales bacterium]
MFARVAQVWAERRFGDGASFASVSVMRNALLVAIGLATITLVACAQDPTSIGIQQRRHTAATAADAIPAAGSEQAHDPTAPDEPADPANPNATTPPPAPETPGTTTGTIAVTIDNPTPATDLGTSIDLTVTIQPNEGFKGDAALTVSGLPAGATGTFSPTSVTLNTTAVTSKLTIKVPATVAPSASGAASPIVVKAASGATEATANANFKVNPRITMTIPVNANAMRAAVGTRYVDGWAGPMFGSAPAPLQTQSGNAITVVVKNADSTSHIVHGNAGFAHGDTANPVPPGGTDPKNRTLAAGVNTSGYLHDGSNGTSESFRISVNTAQ